VAIFKKGSLEENRQELDQALLLDPKAAEAYFWRARVLAGLKKRPEAVADLETALALQPSLNEAYSELAQHYSAAGQEEKAAALLAKQQEQKGKTGSDDRNHFLWDLADPVL
jgi:Flp pilus assembly protein TadD